MGTASVITTIGESRLFKSRHGSRVAIVGSGMLGTMLGLRYRQAGRTVTVFEAEERAERRGHAAIASRDRSLLSLLDELNLAGDVRWEGADRSSSRFGALLGGRGRIVERLRERSRALDVDLRLGTSVRSISADGSGFVVHAGSEMGEFDEVVLTVPSPIASELLTTLPDRERIGLQSVDYVGIVNVSFVLKRAAGQRYISRVFKGGDYFTLLDPGALASTNERRKVVYVTRPFSSNDGFFDLDDRSIIENFARALPGNASIESARVVRMPHAFARAQLPSFTSSIPGLSIVNAAHMGSGRHHLERTAALATSAFRMLCAERIL